LLQPVPVHKFFLLDELSSSKNVLKTLIKSPKTELNYLHSHESSLPDLVIASVGNR